MPLITLESADVRLEIDPELGAGVRRLDLTGALGTGLGAATEPVALWRPAPPASRYFNDLACYSLLPWSNRIAAGRFDFGGRVVQIRPNWPDGTAIHGDVHSRPWRILDRSPVSARLGFRCADFAEMNWPWAFAATTRYELETERDWSAVHFELTLTNEDTTAMPAGGGWHPYFLRRVGRTGEVELRANVTGRYPTRAVMATGPAAVDEVSAWLAAGGRLETRELDDVFPTEAGGLRARLHWAGPVGAADLHAEYAADTSCGHFVLYIPVEREGTAARSGSFFCAEPVSMVNDGFNLAARGQPGTGVRTLAPGETLTLRSSLRLWRGDLV